jgi:hypothetical protein
VLNDLHIFIVWRNWWKLWPRTHERTDAWDGDSFITTCTYSFGPLSVRTYIKGNNNG